MGLAGSQVLAAGPPALHAPGGDFKSSDGFAGPKGADCPWVGRGAWAEGRAGGSCCMEAGFPASENKASPAVWAAAT